MNYNYDDMRYLINTLNAWTISYDAGHPEVSDSEWDKYYFELQALEQNIGVIFPDSPTQTILYELKNQLEKVTHNHKMLSLEKTKDMAAAFAYFEPTEEILIMHKFDGLTCSLTYNDGELVMAETRGDGYIGENILHNAKVVKSIPQKIPYKGTLIVDGEIICRYKDFEPFSKEYKNPRNFAAGSIRLLNNAECFSRNLTFYAWEMITGPSDILTLKEAFDFLSRLGFLTPYIETHFGNEDSENYSYIEECFRKVAEKQSIPIDGLVFKLNSIEKKQAQGETAHHLKGAIAYKFCDEEYTSTLRDIVYDVSRNGILTPVAVFDPIEIEDSIVSRASLHNLAIMTELSKGAQFRGDKLTIIKSNMIIPQVIRWEHDWDNISTSEDTIFLPDVCPLCGRPTAVKDTPSSAIIVCTNEDCGGRLINKLDHFCSKNGLDIKGLSKATLNKLIMWGWINNITDIFKLREHKEEWMHKPGFGELSVQKILDSIEAHRTPTLAALLSALGIPLVGKNTAQKISNYFGGDWYSFFGYVFTGDFTEITDCGPEICKALRNFNYLEIDKLIAEGILTISKSVKTENQSNTDFGTFVITGKLIYYKNRAALEDDIIQHGGKISSSISKNTTALINNDINSTSSKNKKAKELNIPIITEENFIRDFLKN